ncbi:helix-turn-helix domain-containing protein [Lactococcus lactis]|uniref:helix-turn-helix domain-containing protein n=1 Tax=Lactococcus lactis TaxID=1358 RepID=UPI003C6F91D5
MTEETITIPVSLKELASYLATSPETISRKLRAFQEGGLIIERERKLYYFVLFGINLTFYNLYKLKDRCYFYLSFSIFLCFLIKW